MEQDFGEVLGRYEPAVQRLAHRLRPESKSLDSVANDRFDYVAKLRAKVVGSHEKYHERARDMDESKFVLTSLWNETATCFRKVKVRSRIKFDPLTDEMLEQHPDLLTDDRDLENQTWAKQVVDSLRGVMSDDDMAVLATFAASGGVYDDVSRAYGATSRSKNSERRYQAIVAKAREFLEGQSVFGPQIQSSASISVGERQMRQQLEKQADSLGIPFTNDTPDSELRAMIQSRQEPTQVTSPRAAAEVVAKNVGEQIPECFGIMWAATEEPQCAGCPVQSYCLAQMATVEIPERVTAAARAMSPDELAESFGVPVSAINAALSFRQHKAPEGPPPPVDVQTEPPAGPPAPVEAVATQEESVMQKSKAKPKAAKKVAPKKAPKPNGKLPHSEAAAVLGEVQDPKLAGSASPVAAPVKAPEAKDAILAAEQAPLKLLPKSGRSGKAKPVSKKVKPTSVKQTSSTSSKAKKGPPKPVQKAAAKKAPPKRPSKVEPSPRRPEGQEPWGEHTYQARWLRERERSPLIAQVSVGSKLSRDFNGDRCEAQCRQGYWLHKGQKYPTLYAITLAVTGGEKYQVRQGGKVKKGKTRLMSNWSAPRFWKLAAR